MRAFFVPSLERFAAGTPAPDIARKSKPGEVRGTATAFFVAGKKILKKGSRRAHALAATPAAYAGHLSRRSRPCSRKRLLVRPKTCARAQQAPAFAACPNGHDSGREKAVQALCPGESSRQRRAQVLKTDNGAGQTCSPSAGSQTPPHPLPRYGTAPYPLHRTDVPYFAGLPCARQKVYRLFPQ